MPRSIFTHHACAGQGDRLGRSITARRASNDHFQSQVKERKSSREALLSTPSFVFLKVERTSGMHGLTKSKQTCKQDSHRLDVLVVSMPAPGPSRLDEDHLEGLSQVRSWLRMGHAGAHVAFVYSSRQLIDFSSKLFAFTDIQAIPSKKRKS
jgi:hypothetical protein